MIDFHSHVLPSMDDGSTSVQMSLSMLAIEETHGVAEMIATPHFYGSREAPPAFLARRNQSLEALQECMEDISAPRIRLGAEVAYYAGLSNSEFLEDLCIQGTNLILVELPFIPCTERCYQEIESLRRQGFRPVMAHVERYLGMQSPRKFIERLRDGGALIQCNGEFFLQGWRSRKAFAMIKEGYVDVLGSDCHNLTSRAPNLGLTVERLQAKLGEEFTQSFLLYGEHLLDNH